MLKINSIRAFALASAITAATAVTAQNHMQKPNKFLTENVIKTDKNSCDEFILQTAKNNETNTTVSSIRSFNSTNPDFDKAVDYYNDKMTYSERYEVTRNTYTNLENRLYDLEKELDKAFQNCEAYQDIVIVPRWHYRFYPRFNDQLINFDLDELRTRTTKDMASLYKLRDDAACIFEKANGVEKHIEPEKIKYDVDEIATKHLGMSYKEFAESYKEELEFCKTVTYADLYTMSDSQKYVYYKAKAYAEDMLTTTVLEAHTVNWDISEKKVDETIKATNDMYSITDFEYDGITEREFNNIKSGITLKAFEDALLEKYKDYLKTAILNTNTDTIIKKPTKHISN